MKGVVFTELVEMIENEFGLEEPNQTLLSKQDYDDNIDVETALPSKNLPDDAKVLKY